VEYRRKKTASSEIGKTILISSQIDEYEPEDCSKLVDQQQRKAYSLF